jgi:voltage-gated potassium channel
VEIQSGSLSKAECLIRFLVGPPGHTLFATPLPWGKRLLGIDFRRGLHDTLELVPGGGTARQCIQAAVILSILIVVLAIVAKSTGDFDAHTKQWMDWAIQIAMVLFAVEFAARIWLVGAGGTRQRVNQNAFWSRVRYVVSPENIFDLIAILPLLLGLEHELVVVRAFRLMRMLRFTPYGAAVESLEAVFYTERRALIGVFIMLIIMLVVASTLVFVAERDAQPEAFASIPHAMWWGLATLTTVGYGDVTPITAVGRVMGGFVTIIGVGMFALPAAILASGYTREFRRRGFVETWDLVAEVPLFADLSAARIADLAAMLKPRIARAGQIVVRQGEHADSMYFVVSGALEVELDPEPVILHAGDFFGEIALIEHGDRVATIVAMEESRLLLLDAQDLGRFLDRNPELREIVIRVSAERKAGHGGQAAWPAAPKRTIS